MLDSLDRAADLVPVAFVERPNAHAAEVYARLLPVFEQAYDSLVPVFAALRDLPSEG
jgi:gluconokinase